LENAIRRLGTISPDGSISHITGGNLKSAITINGWLRDFLWSQASQLFNHTDHRHQHMV
jgi:hypothetical protein